jgi:hypothetical protein
MGVSVGRAYAPTMDKLVPYLDSVWGLGAGTIIAILLVLYIVRGAVATAVAQAATAEVERLKGTLASELEVKRALFARELEVYKADLALPSEVRRRGAEQKVDALLELIRLGAPLARQIRNAPESSDAEAFAETMAALNGFSVRVVELEHFFDEETADQLAAHSAKLLEAKVEIDEKTGHIKPFVKTSAAHRQLLKIFREELGIVRKQQAAATAPAPKDAEGS